MPSPFRKTLALIVASLIAIAALGAGSVSQLQVTSPPVADCAISNPAFCETFQNPGPQSNREGTLDSTLWGVSRAMGDSGVNFGQNLFNGFVLATGIQSCNGPQTVDPEHAVQVCGGQLREAIDDNQDVAIQSMYPKQPFDFAGRTGIIAFDVSNDQPAVHTDWPELWVTDQPVPMPYTHFVSWLAVPRNGFGIRFAGGNCNNTPGQWSPDSAIVVRNYVPDGSTGPGEIPASGAVALQSLACITNSNGQAGSLNHIEVHVSQNQMDVYGTDAGTVAPLKHIATVPNVNLSFTRGLVWLEDAHYNAHKFGGDESHTFAWDNLGFDGPVLPRDLTFDVPDALTATGYGLTNLGWGQSANQATAKMISPGPTAANIAAAQAALLTFNFFNYAVPTQITATVNGHAHTIAWPYADQTNPNGGGSWRTLAIPLAISDVVAGTNTIAISTNQANAIANVDLVLQGAGGSGGPPPPPAATDTPTTVPTATVVPTATSVSTLVAVATDSPTPVATVTSTPVLVAGATDTPTPSATDTPTPTATPTPPSDGTCTIVARLNGVDTTFTRPLSFCTNQ